jgi:hypothetical protein
VSTESDSECGYLSRETFEAKTFAQNGVLLVENELRRCKSHKGSARSVASVESMFVVRGVAHESFN